LLIIERTKLIQPTKLQQNSQTTKIKIANPCDQQNAISKRRGDFQIALDVKPADGDLEIAVPFLLTITGGVIRL